MYGRVVVGLDSATLAAIARASGGMRNENRFRQSYNLAPGGYLPTAYAKENKSNTLLVKSSEKINNKENSEEKIEEENLDEKDLENFSLEASKWGTKNKDNNSLINARSETVPLYFNHWKRCVIIIEGYYEWKKINSQNDPEKVIYSQPYYIHNKETNFLILAGIYKGEEV